jgi:hypothetical protein
MIFERGYMTDSEGLYLQNENTCQQQPKEDLKLTVTKQL